MSGLVCAAHPAVPGLFAAARTAQRFVYVRRTMPRDPDVVCEEQTVVVPGPGSSGEGAAGRLTALAWAPTAALPLVLAVGDEAGVVWFLVGGHGGGSSNTRGSETEPEERRDAGAADQPRVLSSAELAMDRVCCVPAVQGGG